MHMPTEGRLDYEGESLGSGDYPGAKHPGHMMSDGEEMLWCISLHYESMKYFSVVLLNLMVLLKG